jgi:hypothetical protein
MRECQGGVALSSVPSYKSFEYGTGGLTQPARSEVLHGFLDRQRGGRFALSLADEQERGTRCQVAEWAHDIGQPGRPVLGEPSHDPVVILGATRPALRTVTRSATSAITPMASPNHHFPEALRRLGRGGGSPDGRR